MGLSHRTVIIVQARMESQRYPGKILADFCGQPMLVFQLARLRALDNASRNQHLIVASVDTPLNASEVAPLMRQHGYTCWLSKRAPDDVLGRFYEVAEHLKADRIVRITGDCPLLSADVAQGCMDMHGLDDDHVGIAPEWGDGFDCEVISMGALEAAHKGATLASDREHVTPYIFRPSHHFDCATSPCPLDLSWMRCSVDTKEDLFLVEKIATVCLKQYGPDFTWRHVWAACVNEPNFRSAMEGREHNPAYVAQVAAEQRTVPTGMTWRQIRYDLEPQGKV